MAGIIKPLATTYFPKPDWLSIIGSRGLNCSVRNGKRCIPSDIVTKRKIESKQLTVSSQQLRILLREAQILNEQKLN